MSAFSFLGAKTAPAFRAS